MIFYNFIQISSVVFYFMISGRQTLYFTIFVPILYFVTVVAYREYKKNERELNLVNIVEKELEDQQEREDFIRLSSCCPTGCKEWIERGISGLVNSTVPRFRMHTLKYWSKQYKNVFLLFKTRVK